MDQLQGQITQTEGADILMSLPKYSQWQAMNVYKGGRSYARKLKANREWVESMLTLALPVLQTAIDGHGRIAVEWPRNTLLWEHPTWQEFDRKNGLRRVYFDGCALGIVGKHYPIKKPWCISTSCLRLIQYLQQYTCDGSHVHEHAEGSLTEQTGFYPVEMANVLCEALYPSAYYRHESASTLARGLVTQNLPKKVWSQDPKALEDVAKEANGLRSNGTWLDESAIPVADLRQQARNSGETIKVAELLTLCGIKHIELSPEAQKYKGRIVYRGDCVISLEHCPMVRMPGRILSDLLGRGASLFAGPARRQHVGNTSTRTVDKGNETEISAHCQDCR